MECRSRKNLHPCIFTEYPGRLKCLREKCELTDVTVHVGEKTYYGHSIILALASNFFKTMFISHFQEDKQRMVTIESISETDFEIILDYMYGEKLTITNDNAVFLLIACDFLQMGSASALCYRFILDNLSTIGHIFNLYNFLCVDSDYILFINVRKYVSNHWCKICENEDFTCLSFDALKDLLTLRHLILSKSDEMFNLCEKWVIADIKLRHRYIAELTELLRRKCVFKDKYNFVNALVKYDTAKPYIDQIVIPDRKTPRTLGKIEISEDKPYFSASEEKQLRFYNFDGHNWAPLRGYGMNREFSNRISHVNTSLVYENLFVIAEFKDFNIPKQFYVTNMRTKRSTFIELPISHQDRNQFNDELMNCQNNLFNCEDTLAFCDQWRVYTFSQDVNRWLVLSTNSISKFPPNYSCDGRFIYAVGSESAVNNYQTRMVHKFDHRCKTWQRLAPLPSNIGRLSSCFLDYNLYVANYDLMYMYDFRNNQWIKLPSLPYFNGFGTCMAKYQRKIYYLQVFNWFSCYNLHTSTWSPKERPFLNCNMNIVHNYDE